MAAQARHAVHADNAARTGAGSAIIAHIPVSAAAQARQKAAAKHGDRPSGKDLLGAVRAETPQSDSDMTAQNSTSGAIFSPVPDLAALIFSGADAASFMQGQFTGDVRALGENGAWQRSAYCSPKGRMLANFILLRRTESEHAALLSADIADETAKRLRMFVLRAKVDIVRAPAAFVFAAGDFSPPDFSDDPDAVAVAEGAGRHLLCHLQGDANRLLPAGAELTADNFAWRRAQIADAVPWVRAETRDMFIPQHVNYEAPPLSGVNFQKGCYVGQEVVARLHYRGAVKRRARPGCGDGPPPPPGAVLRDSQKQAAGNVVDAVPTADGAEKFATLICAQLSATELFLEDGREARLLPPPHPIPDDQAK